MTKQDIRLDLRQRRKAFVDAMDLAELCAHLAALTARVLREIEGASCVAAYLPVGPEIDPSAILDAAAGAGMRTALPHIGSAAAPMRFLAWQPGEPLLPGPLGLLQPDPEAAAELAPEVILAPLVGFDRNLARLGQGKAFYDRAFAALPHARRIGLAWSVQEVDALPVEPWDVPLHAVATEKEWITR
ncbi:5-formyltetrahydrofolate cyclo-ligase [Flavisphingomonas formosensis]|uniref:5-formyltetrahydrofolate cyclo-ligase n=1 Tax=Flavisphingomonas formosensis TaxID=861534 RepID=UPI0012FA31C6|nr:5-formyltetrahydrofolate cyclo-ligase [Sphingomonas formosensis]